MFKLLSAMLVWQTNFQKYFSSTFTPIIIMSWRALKVNILHCTVLFYYTALFYCTIRCDPEGNIFYLNVDSLRKNSLQCTCNETHFCLNYNYNSTKNPDRRSCIQNIYWHITNPFKRLFSSFFSRFLQVWGGDRYPSLVWKLNQLA